MVTPQRLGGFKVLKNLCRFSIFEPDNSSYNGLGFFHLLAGKYINLSFITFAVNGGFFGTHILLDKDNRDKVFALAHERFTSNIVSEGEDVILSLFPHKRDLNVPKKLFGIFSAENIKPTAFASSPSTISVVIRQEMLDRMTSALFGPFVFGPYRSPSDWKLAQRGKEKLYKEVVASYQEKRPKTYGIELEPVTECLVLKLGTEYLDEIGVLLTKLEEVGVPLSFIASVPSKEQNRDSLLVSISGLSRSEIGAKLGGIGSNIIEDTLGAVSVLSMTGPHFGDRYGIVSQLLTCLEEQNIEPVAISCTIASISCILNSGYEPEAIEAIKQRFEIPHVVNKAS